ncbi:MAG: dienelactone hydrolase family protein [Deltaproteobacteria bacterium]
MAIREEEVTYRAGDTTLKGFLALPEGAGPHPAVLVVHEWWGLTDYIRGRARQMAELGYVGLAVDMYGAGQVADDPSAAGKLMGSVTENIQVGELRFRAALDLVDARDDVASGKIAAIGYCFGGAIVLQAAKVGMPLAAVVSFHGALGSFHAPAAGEVKARVLVCHGADDVLVPDADIENFKKEMDAAGANYAFEAYPGALHGFSNPEADERAKAYGMPIGYDPATDKKSFAAMQALFLEVF